MMRVNPNLIILFIYNMPFRALAKMAVGKISMEMVEGIVTVINGHFLHGVGKIVGDYIRDRKKNKVYEAKLTGKQ